MLNDIKNSFDISSDSINSFKNAFPDLNHFSQPEHFFWCFGFDQLLVFHFLESSPLFIDWYNLGSKYSSLTYNRLPILY